MDDIEWEKSFNELSAYKKEFGDCDLPSNYSPNKALEAWVSTQRTNKKKYKLDSERTKKLEELGFKWSFGSQNELDIALETSFNELLAYKKEFGNCDVPSDYPPNKALGRWVSAQRQNNKKGKLGLEKIEKLEELGFNWEPRDTTWETSFKELITYKKEFWDCNVPQDYPENKALKIWVDRQRQNNKKDKLGSEKFKKLEELGFKWSFNNQE